MKAIDIAVKELVSGFRSAFSIIFMFVIPVLVTGIFYVMFGGSGESGFEVPVTKVVVVNQDAGGAGFDAIAATLPHGDELNSFGDLLIHTLEDAGLEQVIDLSSETDEAEARRMVDTQQAGVAIIIPANFTDAYSDMNRLAEISLYADPTLTIGPAIVKSVLGQLVDSLSGNRITVQLALAGSSQISPDLIPAVLQRYQEAMPQEGGSSSMVIVRSPSGTEDAAGSKSLITIFMGGMMIMFSFYTGTATAESILRDEENHTLPRLFTTPTPSTTILTGKFLAVFLMVFVQVTVLLIFARLVFKIDWGSPAAVALMAAGIILPASAFGIFVNSFLTNTKQGGLIFGGVLTFTGMLGLIRIFTAGSPVAATWSRTVSFFTPQGWAVEGMFHSLDSAPWSQFLTTGLVLLGWSIVFFTIGVLRFRRRYA